MEWTSSLSTSVYLLWTEQKPPGFMSDSAVQISSFFGDKQAHRTSLSPALPQWRSHICWLPSNHTSPLRTTQTVLSTCRTPGPLMTVESQVNQLMGEARSAVERGRLRASTCLGAEGQWVTWLNRTRRVKIPKVIEFLPLPLGGQTYLCN